MRDNEILAVLVAQIDAGFDRLPAPGPTVETIQDYQPTTQGAPTGPVLALHVVFTRRYGWTARKDEWIIPATPDLPFMRHTERQQLETHIQASGIWRRGPTLPGDWVAADVAGYGAMILQSDRTMAALRAAGLGIQRITDIRSTPILTNDRDQWEAMPSFDFVLTHEQITITETPATVSQELRIENV